MRRFVHTSGFTLVELSIVLVIVGLIVGGVLVGADLISGAQSRKVISEYDKLRATINAFRMQYGALPGDMPNATAFWGSTPSDWTTGTGTQTRNGNGNGKIGATVDCLGAPDRYEVPRMWQHLSNARLMPNDFTGIATHDCPLNGGYCCYRPGVDVPKGPVDGSIWIVFNAPGNVDIGWGPAWAGKLQERMVIALGANLNTVNASFAPGTSEGSWYGEVLTSQETYNVDVKMDDGRPNTGVLNISLTSGTSCADSSLLPNAKYKLVGGRACVLLFDLDF